jgi:hypothetical protein
MKLTDLSNVNKNPPADDIPVIQVTDLPSKFKPYPEGSKITYSPFTFGEMIKSNNSNLSQKEMDDLIMRGIKTEGFKKEDLIWVDFRFIAILRKISTSSSSMFNIKYTCSECDTFNDQNLPLTSINFADLEVTALPIKFTCSNQELHASPLTYKNYYNLSNLNKLEDAVAVYASSIINKTFTDAYNIISSAREEDSDVLSEVDRLLNFGNNTTSCTCTKCNHIDVKEMRDISSLIFPLRRDTSA